MALHPHTQQPHLDILPRTKKKHKNRETLSNYALKTTPPRNTTENKGNRNATGNKGNTSTDPHTRSLELNVLEKM